MKKLSPVTGINLGILLVYSIIIRFINTGSEKSLGILITSALVISLHVFVLLIIAIVMYAERNKEYGKVYLLSSGIVLLVGFSSCLANASI